MLNMILIDAGPLIALFDRSDRYHVQIKDFLQQGRYKLITTTAVMTEVLHMIDFNVEVQLDFLQWVALQGVLLQEISQQDISRIIELTRKYSDRPMDFADATLVIAAEKTGIRKIISIDTDFDIYRLPNKVQIENVFRI
ncbi:hypothetical protein F967_01970 [Acinetobacter sp. CIP 102637]|uniref:type II toxin-antitoxin system VapC family toxin n=1 Tax=Acinetobacter sp. CIP 102637 TaxID=1144669 RepID=UPI0002CFA484|nr:PIN domain-containing protein [Acinetobacter sp. CIP 102637]ENV05221.1 hypothetical protein F967_01970 [Acinetobacter sp. CIP 102637]